MRHTQEFEAPPAGRPARLVAARELTKIHEEFLSGEAGSVREALAARGGVKGEITLMIARREAPAEDDPRPLGEAMEAVKAVARHRGLAKGEVYRAVVNDP